ncbi:glycosyltransferase [Patescibacteria group bacterium]|nr:glycosyltransferase [Patescibacteria group bacterium]MBU1472577.1 glycosyltransferase [Patescibacteria group bacterium]MBU2459828.1 glycosyltransferase [Patescibacteria group bacterium]MBU2544111.1 glycosyltransferase [Patescibacteria group bacterium]
MTPVHVGVFTYYYLPIINGVILTISDWQKELRKFGISQTVFVPKRDYMKPLNATDVFEYPSISLYKKFGITIPLFAEQLLPDELTKRKINIIHAHHPYYIGSLAVRLAKKRNIPVVFTYHTMHSEYVKTYLPFIPGRWIEKYVERSITKLMNTCSCVTVSLPNLKTELIQKGVTVPIHVVPIGIDTERFSKGGRIRVRKELEIKDNETLLLSVGRIAKEKNVDFLLSMFSYLSKKNDNLRLCFIGDGPRENFLRQIAQEKHLEEKVKIMAPKSYDIIQDYYHAADVFVYASQTETFGRVYVEAMASGLPVVALATPSLADVIEDGVSGVLVHTKTPASFAREVEKLIDNKDMRLRFGDAARLRASEVFSLSSSGKTLASLYRSLVES